MTPDQTLFLCAFAPLYIGCLAWLSCRIGFGIGA